jgi:hypothetical protein
MLSVIFFLKTSHTLHLVMLKLYRGNLLLNGFGFSLNAGISHKLTAAPFGTNFAKDQPTAAVLSYFGAIFEKSPPTRTYFVFGPIWTSELPVGLEKSQYN